MHESGRETTFSCLHKDIPCSDLESKSADLLQNNVTQFFDLVTPRVLHEANVANVACNECRCDVCVCPIVAHDDICSLCGEPNHKPYEAYFCSLCQRVNTKVDIVILRNCREFDRKHLPKSAA